MEQHELNKRGNKTVLITGASSGIGSDLAKLFSEDGYDLILVARGNEALNKVASNLSQNNRVSIEIISKDLSIPGAAAELFNEIQNKGLIVDVLVNNAGFGLYGEFLKTSWEKEAQMIQLNITALTQLTKLFLPQMIKMGRGKILNVASTAAFQPGPLMAVYYATKAYVLLFSEAIAKELEGTGVTVTALCPGPTRSGFQKAASMEKSRLIKNKIATTSEVARIGYSALMRGKPVVIAGFLNNVLAQSIRFLPRKLVTTLSKAAVAPE